MYTSVAEFEELVQMRENVRRSLQTLEVCWSCEKVSDCEQQVVDDGPPVWLCPACQETIRARLQKRPMSMRWPGLE